MGPESRLLENFSCAKCRSKQATLRTTHTPADSLKELIQEGIKFKYYLLTCALCGYTEMYDARVFATSRSTCPEASPLPENS